MPSIGLGVWRMEKSEVHDIIINSIKLGYRHFDCAADYKNESQVGEALSKATNTGLVNRIDYSLLVSALADDSVLDIDTTISLETTWHAMEDLVTKGFVRSIGISNYDIFLTRDCLAYSKVKPVVNQIETHTTMPTLNAII
ncbi:hypothetical protein ACFE04_009786 [Oxalis oulophora]